MATGRRSSALLVVVALATLYAVLFTFLAFRRHDSFNTWGLDLGNMDQVVWNTLHGRPFAFTNMEGITNRLAIHVEPILLLIAPLYLLWSDPKALLVLQTVALASGAVPVFYVAQRELKSGTAAVIVAASYLLFPSLQAVNVAEFHPVALSTPLLLWAFYLGSNDRWWGFAATSLLAACTKEEVGLVVALLGVYLAVTRRARFPLLVAAVGTAWSLFAVLVVIAVFNPLDISPYAGYYRYLGDSLPDMAVGLLTQPWILPQRLADCPEYLASLLLPTGFLDLLSPERLLLGLPSLLINGLANYDSMHRPNLYHYTAPLIPAVLLATIQGAARAQWILWRLGLPSGRALAVVAALLLFASGAYQRFEGLTPLAVDFSLPPITDHDRVGYEVMKLVPPGVPLSVQTELNPHLSQREKLYIFPTVGDAEYILADRLRDPGAAPNRPTWLHQMRLDRLEELMRSGQFSVVLDRDGYLLLKRKE